MLNPYKYHFPEKAGKEDQEGAGDIKNGCCCGK